MNDVEFLEEYAVSSDSGMVDFRVEVLAGGAISVNAQPVIELEQETYHCYFRHLASPSLPLAPAQVCEKLAANTPPELSPDWLRALSLPLRLGAYDVLQTPLAVRRYPHRGLRVSCPLGYAGQRDYPRNAWGAYWCPPDAPPGSGYGQAFSRAETSELYAGEVEDFGLLLLPLVPSERLDLSCVSAYQQQVLEGGCPTVLAFGFYANERCLVLAVLDGHHKLFAAAETTRSIRLLAFISPRLLSNFEEMRQVQPPGQCEQARSFWRTRARCSSPR